MRHQRPMPTVDEAIILSVRERSIIPFISLRKLRKTRKKHIVTIVLSSSATWLLHAVCLFPIAMMPIMFCFAASHCVFLLCVPFWSFLVIGYAKKQSQPTWCFRDSLLHCIALPVTCCFSIGSIISHSFSAFQINLPFFKATIPLTARQQFPGNNPSWVKIFSEKANSHVTNKICGQNYLNWLGDFFF